MKGNKWELVSNLQSDSKGGLVKLLLLLTYVLILMSCENLFTTSAFSGFKTPFSQMSDEQKDASIVEIIAEGSEAERDEAIAYLEKKRGTITATSSDADKQDYVDDTLKLAELASANADLEGALTTLIESSSDGGSAGFLDDLTGDTERLEDLQAASGYMVEAYTVDPESLNTTQLLVGSAGLVSDILQDPVQKDTLENVPDYETATLQAAGFSAEEIDNIQTANEMLDLAKTNGLPDSIAQGLPF